MNRPRTLVLCAVLLAAGTAQAQVQAPEPLRLLIWGPSGQANAEAGRQLHAALPTPGQTKLQDSAGGFLFSFGFEEETERPLVVEVADTPPLSYEERRRLLSRQHLVAFVPAGKEGQATRSLQRLQDLLSETGASRPLLLFARKAEDCALAPALECVAPGDAGPLAVVAWARRSARPAESEPAPMVDLPVLQYPEPARPLTAAAKKRLEQAHGIIAASSLADDQLRDSLLPTVWLAPQAAQTDLPLGASRFGGAPDLPLGLAWPRRGERPLTFLAQLRMAELRGLDASALLPEDGWLVVFYDAEEQPWGGGEDDPEGMQVVYVDGPVSRLQRRAKKGEAPPSMAPLAVHAGFSLPSELPTPLAEAFPKDSGKDLWTEWFSLRDAVALKPFANNARHHLLGHPDEIQGEMRTDLPGDPQDWVLLLQLDSEEVPGAVSWTWGDVGRLYFWIRRDDLARRDFSKVRCLLQCS